MILGITGPFAAGKSLAAAFFARKGFLVIDADKTGHAVLEDREIIRKVVRKFGKEILAADAGVPAQDRGAADLPHGRMRINRKKLGAIVFRKPALLKKLNNIVHPRIMADVQKAVRVGKKKGKNILIEAALLFEFGLEDRVDRVITVTAPLKVLIARGKKRNGFDSKRVRAVLSAQMSPAEKVRRADYVIVNSGTPRQLEQKLKQLLK